MKMIVFDFETQVKCLYYSNREVLFFKRHMQPRWLGHILFYIFIPYFLIKWMIITLYENLYTKNKLAKIIEEDKQKSFEHELAIVSISKNEAIYLKEWIEYHLMLGVTKFYFYDNESTDNTYEILQPYIENDIVEYTFIKGIGKQLCAYNDAIERHKNEVRYMAFIDMDEYLFPMQNGISLPECITKILNIAPFNTVGIGINWCMFGSNGLIKRPKDGLLTQNFVRRANNNFWANYHIKCICNPRFITNYISPHYPICKVGTIVVSESNGERLYGWFCHNVEYKYLRLNHYYCKSHEDYIIKVSRGLGDRAGEYDNTKFEQYDRNEIFDNAASRYSDVLKQRLAENFSKHQ